MWLLKNFIGLEKKDIDDLHQWCTDIEEKATRSEDTWKQTISMVSNHDAGKYNNKLFWQLEECS